MGLADGEPREYRHKVADLEGVVATKDAELLKQASILKQKEAAAKQVADARTTTEDRVKQLMKRLQDLEAAAMRKLLLAF